MTFKDKQEMLWYRLKNSISVGKAPIKGANPSFRGLFNAMDKLRL